MDLLWPSWLVPARSRFRYVGSTGRSVGEFTGVTRTAGKGGDRVAVVLDSTPLGGRTSDGKLKRAALLSRLMALQGQQNRIWIEDDSHTRRGSFPASELLPNNTFANGTTGWTGTATTTRAVTDRVMRVTRNQVGATSNACGNSSAVTVTQFAPYVQRWFVRQGRGSYPTGHTLTWGATAGAADYAISGDITTYGMLSHAHVPYVTSMFAGIRDRSTSGQLAGDYIDIPYASLSRCALVDNGPNSLLQSDEFDATWTATRASVDDQAAATPDGTSTADSIIEDSTASNSHFVIQTVTVSATALDYAFSVAVKAGARTWVQIVLTENTGATSAFAYVNLSTGALGNVSNGANWSNPRAFTRSLGNGWWLCSVVAQKANAATSISARIGLATGDNGVSYTGDGTSNIYAWRATLAQSSVPTRLVGTTTTATTGTSQSGNALHLKGLPASTSGLLLYGDWFEVVTPTYSSLHMATASLDSDAAGLGYLQFSPPLRRSPADSAPVIIHEPRGRFLVTSDFIEWANEPGVWSSAQVELEEAGV